MSFDVVFGARAETEFYSWDLPLPVIDEIERQFAEVLSERPKEVLRDIGGTLQFVCRAVEPGNTSVVHLCLFRIRYSQDEESLIIWDCSYFPLRK